MYYVKLLPIAENLISSFRLLATRENQTATSLGRDQAFRIAAVRFKRRLQS